MGKTKGPKPMLKEIPNSVTEEKSEEWVKMLWEEVRRVKMGNEPNAKAPFTELDLDRNQADLEDVSRYGDLGSKKSEKRESTSTKTLPSFVGSYEAKSEIKRVPTRYNPKPRILDSSNLHALLSVPVKVTLPLAKILKLKPELWVEMTKTLEKMGVKVPNLPNPGEEGVDAPRKEKCEPIPINKVGDYCEGEEGNTTLPIEFGKHKCTAILDSGARVAIVTKQVWESWGKPPIRKTRTKTLTFRFRKYLF